MLQNHGFLQIVIYAYLHVMEDPEAFKTFIRQMILLCKNNTRFQESIIELFALHFSKKDMQLERAIEFVKDQQKDNFNLLNSPRIYALLTFLRQRQLSLRLEHS